MGTQFFLKKDFKIAKIVDEYSIVINAGSSVGVNQGDIFEIFAPGLEILDPDTNEFLGYLDYIKGKVVAKTVFEKMSVCTNQDVASSIIENFSTALEGKPAELNVDSMQISGGYELIQKKIRVGDYVRKVAETNNKKVNQECP